MCRVMSAELPADASSAAAARALMATTARDWRLDPLLADCQVALSELVTNAICHAGTPMTVTFAVATGFLEVNVGDGSSLLPRIRAVRADLDADIATLLGGGAEPADIHDRDPRMHVGAAGAVLGGRGLLLIEAIVDTWGARSLDVGKVVWFRMRLPPGWHDHEPCTCTTSPPNLELGSGQRVRKAA